jgi:hypothetical protein
MIVLVAVSGSFMFSGSSGSSGSDNFNNLFTPGGSCDMSGLDTAMMSAVTDTGAVSAGFGSAVLAAGIYTAVPVVVNHATVLASVDTASAVAGIEATFLASHVDLGSYITQSSEIKNYIQLYNSLQGPAGVIQSNSVFFDLKNRIEWLYVLYEDGSAKVSIRPFFASNNEELVDGSIVYVTKLDAMFSGESVPFGKLPDPGCIPDLIGTIINTIGL